MICAAFLHAPVSGAAACDASGGATARRPAAEGSVQLWDFAVVLPGSIRLHDVDQWSRSFHRDVCARLGSWGRRCDPPPPPPPPPAAASLLSMHPLLSSLCNSKFQSDSILLPKASAVYCSFQKRITRSADSGVSRGHCFTSWEESPLD